MGFVLGFVFEKHFAQFVQGLQLACGHGLALLAVIIVLNQTEHAKSYPCRGICTPNGPSHLLNRPMTVAEIDNFS